MIDFSLTSLLPLPEPLVIVDVGASYIGERPRYQSLLDLGRGRLVAFEPDAAACATLRNLYGPPHLVLPYFVGDGSAQVFYQTNWSPTGSLLKPNAPVVDKFQNLGDSSIVIAEHPVQTRRLDDIPEISSVDHLKLDVQGAELMVLNGAGRLLDGVALVQIEVEFMELYKGQPLFGEVDTYLRARGFCFHTFAGFGTRTLKPTVHAGDANRGINQILWADAVYVRNWVDPGSLSVDALARLAILAHDLFSSVDLCHYLLSAIDARVGGNTAAAYRERISAKAG